MDMTILFRVIALIALVVSVANFARVWLRSTAATETPRRPSGPLPRPTGAAKPHPAGSSTTKVASPSVNAGLAAHQQRGLAKTAKLPAATDRPATPAVPPTAVPAPTPAPAKPSDDDDAMNTLFAGVAKPDATPAAEAERKVSRLQELGFHHSINPSDPTSKPASPTAPRSNTAELNSILERIDQFLADEPKDGSKEGSKAEAPAAPASAPPKPTEPVDTQAKTEPMIAAKPAEAKTDQQKTTPLWARPDAVDEDVTQLDKPAEGEQQRLF